MSAAPVTLVIASRNRGPLIRGTIESALAQTLRFANILVFNDGGCAETSSFLSSAFPDVRVVTGVGGSAASARNKGAYEVVTPYIAFLDDDDVMFPNALEVLWRALCTFPEGCAAFADHSLSAVGGSFHLPRHHDQVGFKNLQDTRPQKVQDGVKLFGRELYYSMLCGNLLQQPWLVRSETFFALRGFDESLSSNEDRDLYLRLTSDFKVVVVDDVISDHRIESERDHVSRSASVEQTGRAILHKHERTAARRCDIRAFAILRKRLAIEYKMEGDNRRRDDARAALQMYWRALRYWPLDHVVLARSLVILPLEALRRRFVFKQP